jgi:hypothetical protein
MSAHRLQTAARPGSRSAGLSSTRCCGLFPPGLACVHGLLAIVVGMTCEPRPAEAASEDRAVSLPVACPVAVDHAYLRAGPGDDYYPTERLGRGEQVEVWAVEPTGWCAIRPVRGSFSWLRAADVDREPAPAEGESTSLQEDHDSRRTSEPARDETSVGVIVIDGAVSRIGSQLNELRHVAQVRLEAGERVRILDEVRVAEGRHAGLWVRIHPPAGEFRWVSAADLVLPADLLPADGPVAVSRDPSTRAAGAGSPATSAPGLLPGGYSEPIPQGLPPRAGEPYDTSSMPPPITSWTARGTGILDREEAAVPRPVSGQPLRSAEDEIGDIDLALSLAVTGPPESWNLAPLRDRLRLAAGRAASLEERQRADAVDARLARFESILGQRAVAAAPDGAMSPLRLGSMWSALSALGSRPIRPGVLPGGQPADGTPTWTPPDQAETTGRLATVVSRRPDAPRWALVDQSNQVIAFISPSSPVNLAAMVGQEIAVRGTRGYMPEYRRPYLVASEAKLRVAAGGPPAVGSLR